jgi:hypothetical protein
LLEAVDIRMISFVAPFYFISLSCDLLQLIRMKSDGRMSVNLDEPIEHPSFGMKWPIQALLPPFDDNSLRSNIKRFDYPDLGTNLKAHGALLSVIPLYHPKKL